MMETRVFITALDRCQELSRSLLEPGFAALTQTQVGLPSRVDYWLLVFGLDRREAKETTGRFSEAGRVLFAANPLQPAGTFRGIQKNKKGGDG
jgi:hypothetical protein